jgi:hypothetical protein
MYLICVLSVIVSILDSRIKAEKLQKCKQLVSKLESIAEEDNLEKKKEIYFQIQKLNIRNNGKYIENYRESLQNFCKSYNPVDFLVQYKTEINKLYFINKWRIFLSVINMSDLPITNICFKIDYFNNNEKIGSGTENRSETIKPSKSCGFLISSRFIPESTTSIFIRLKSADWVTE